MAASRIATLLAVAAAGGAHAFGFGAAAQQPVFRSGTAIVEVTVSVRDRDGRFIGGLTAADFELLEEDRPRPIESMYVVTGPAADRHVRAAAATPAPPGGRAAPRTFVFAFDLAQMSPRSFTRARDAAITFARQRLTRDDMSALAVLGQASSGRASGIHEELIAALERLKPSSELVSRDKPLREWPRILHFQEAAAIARGNPKALEEARDRACRELDTTGTFRCIEDDKRPGAEAAPAGKKLGAFEAEANRDTIEQRLREKSASYIAESRKAALGSIASLQALARVLEATRGRKTIVWFTEGTPILEAANQARETAARAAQSGVAVYTIDPRGQQSRAADVAEVGAQELGHDLFSDTGDLPAMMASATGGLYIRNENRLDRALARIEDDTSSYYVVGYAASSDSTARKITVRVKRDGISARVRYGFMAPEGAVTIPGSMVATNMLVVPGTRWELAVPIGPTRPTPPPSTETTPNPRSHVPATERVLKLRDASASSNDFPSRAWRAYERGDLEAALPLFEEAARRSGVRPWALYALGFTYVGMNRPRDAITVWERVRAAAPDFMPVYLDLAAHYAQSDNVSRALAILREAARRWPDDPEPQNGIGVLTARRSAFDDAIGAFTRATQLAPDDPLSWLNLGRAYELRYDRTLRYDELLLRYVGAEGDRVKALAAYDTCASLGGPYARQAADAIARMNWSQ